MALLSILRSHAAEQRRREESKQQAAIKAAFETACIGKVVMQSDTMPMPTLLSAAGRMQPVDVADCRFAAGDHSAKRGRSWSKESSSSSSSIAEAHDVLALVLASGDFVATRMDAQLPKQAVGECFAPEIDTLATVPGSTLNRDAESQARARAKVLASFNQRWAPVMGR